MDKVKTIALWHALNHNMVCTWRLIPFPYQHDLAM